MAVDIKWRRWEAASYDFLSRDPDAVVPQLQDLVEAWINTVNSNPSNTGRQLSMPVKIADLTNPTHAGFVIQANANNNTQQCAMQYGVRNASVRSYYLRANWVNDGSNDGWGVFSSSENGFNDTSISFLTSNSDWDWLITSDTEDGKEFLTLGAAYNNSTAYSEGFTIFKSTTGEWCLVQNDSADYGVLHYFDDALGSEWITPSRIPGSQRSGFLGSDNFLLMPLAFYRSDSSTITTLDRYTYQVSAANEKLGAISTSVTGTRYRFGGLGDGFNVYQLQCYAYGPRVFVDQRT